MKRLYAHNLDWNNSIFMLGNDNKLIKRDCGLEMVNFKTIRRIQEKFKDQFISDNLIIDNFCIKRGK